MNGYRRDQDHGSSGRQFSSSLFNSANRGNYPGPRYETEGNFLRSPGGVFGSDRGSQRMSSGAMHQPDRYQNDSFAASYQAGRDFRTGSSGMLQAGRSIPRGSSGPSQQWDFPNASGRGPSEGRNLDPSGRLFPRDSLRSGNMYSERASQRDLGAEVNPFRDYSDRSAEVPLFQKAYRLDRESQRWVPVYDAPYSNRQRDPREVNQAGKPSPWIAQQEPFSERGPHGGIREVDPHYTRELEAAKRRGQVERPPVWEEKRIKMEGQFNRSARGAHSNFRQGPKGHNTAQQDPQKRTGLTESCKVGIVHKGFPEKCLTQEQLAKLKQNILDKVLEQQNKDFKPVFLESASKPGWLYINCAQKATSEWLKKVIDTLKPWENADLQVLDESKIPREQVLVGNFLDSIGETNEKILGYIKAQNKELDLAEWKVLKKSLDGDLTIVTLSVDLVSAQKLKSSALKINYKFGQVQLRDNVGDNNDKNRLQRISVKAPTPEPAAQSKNRDARNGNDTEKGKNQQDQHKGPGDDLRSVLLSKKSSQSQNFKGRNWNDDLSDEDH